ncbi:MAG: 30S ribosomal protein S2 [Caldilineaceae bacterium]|nr:30S ribosomal protein S2 [Caldilineaceae bacterium]
MAVVSMKELLEAGVHFGHRTRRWNPKMRPFIFTERSGIHIIDLQQTMHRLNEYAGMIREISSRGGTILFVGTKRQAQATVQQEADRCGMPYINQRWLGGTLTNWVTIKQRIDYLLQIERRFDGGEFRTLSKKEQLEIQREIEKLNRRIGGLKTMRRLPELIFIVDINTEDLAVMEANKLRIPTIAMVDTNSNPDLVDYVIPSNDDAIRAVKLIVSVIADAVEEGARIREVDMADIGQVSKAALAEQEQYLGPSTLAKLKATVEDFESFEGDEGEYATPADDEGDEYEEYEFEAVEEDGDAFGAFNAGKDEEEEE